MTFNASIVAMGLLAMPAVRGEQPSSCPMCPAWNVAQQPFRVYGNTYYVGVRGLSSILIASPKGHVLIDGALPESVPNIVAGIRSLGFRVEDVKLIVNSHVHFDHAGGLAELQRLSGATVAASPGSAKVLQQGFSGPDDPQYGKLPPIPAVTRVRVIEDGQTLHMGSIALTAHLTPGHTPGGTSWMWKSCEKERCLDIVYADSLNAVSADGFFFTRSREYPNALADFEKSFAALSAVPCDILLAPHPEFADLFGKLARRQQRTTPDPFVDPNACRSYVNAARNRLEKRVAEENSKPQAQ